MRDLFVHSPFVRTQELTAADLRQCYRATSPDEVRQLDRTGVDRREDDRVDDERAEFFHDVERESRTTVAGLMVESEIGIESHRLQCDGQVLRQQRVPEG